MQSVAPQIRAALDERFPGVLPEGDVPADGFCVPADQHYAFAETLKGLGYRLYVTVCASHWPGDGAETPETFEVATVLRAPGQGIFEWRVALGADEAIDTLYPLFAGADWQEREQFDLVGVRFEGHPDLRRLMLPEDWEGHPLRKDYAIDTPHPPWR